MARPSGPGIASLARALRTADAAGALTAFSELQAAAWSGQAVADACARARVPLLEVAVVHAVDAARHFISPHDMEAWSALVGLALDAGVRPRLKNPKGHAGVRFAAAWARGEHPLHARATAVIDALALRLLDAGLSPTAPRARMRRDERVWGETVAHARSPLPRFRARWDAVSLAQELPGSTTSAVPRRL